MMEPFNIDLTETHESWYFAVDSQDHTEYLYKKHAGLQQRRFGEKKMIRTLELSDCLEAKPLIYGHVTTTALKTKVKELDFHPARILRENEPVLATLRQLELLEWRVVFRAQHTARIIFKKERKEIKSYFHYYSILVTLRLKDHRDYIEVGEGSVHALKFNQDGLCARLKRVVTNHRQSQNISFQEKVPVILNSGDGGILFHELLGHALEADYIYRNQSPITYSDLGKAIVSPTVTLLTRFNDDPFFKEVVSDDDGEIAPSPVLIEQGVLQNVIADSYYKQKLQLAQAGFSRLQDFSTPPMPRMYGLYLAPGPYHPEELIAATPYGVYAGEFGEGKVFFNKNTFSFFIRDSHLIEKGKLTIPLGSIVVQGNILEVLNSVAMVADDFRFDKGISNCSKYNQTIPVRVGQPTVKVNNLYITPYKGVQYTWPH